LVKTYGIKVWCYWEHLEEHIGNLGNILKLDQNLWESNENTLGATKNNNPSSLPFQCKNKITLNPLDCMLSLLIIGCMIIMVLKLFVTIFNLG